MERELVGDQSSEVKMRKGTDSRIPSREGDDAVDTNTGSKRGAAKLKSLSTFCKKLERRKAPKKRRHLQ
jgi:hypothetical protein